MIWVTGCWRLEGLSLILPVSLEVTAVALRQPLIPIIPGLIPIHPRELKLRILQYADPALDSTA